MKLAIVHDDLIQFGGAENVLLELHELFPNAPVYTAVVSKKWQKICKDKGINLKTSFMQKLPFVEKLNRYYSPFLLHALAFQEFDLSEYDVVLSVSARYAHGVITRPTTVHVCYMNSPARMLWEPKDYFAKEKFGWLSPLKALAQPFLALPLSTLRLWDYASAQRVDYFIANSKTPQARIKKYYDRASHIIYPFVDVEEFAPVSGQNEGYFLIITRLASWKKVELAVEACNKLKLPLKVVGEGPDKESLQKLAGSTVEILGYVSEEQKQTLLAGCSAVINTQFEDFGIVPLEAMAAGKPVIAYGKGGVLETVVPGETGEFFYTQTAQALQKVLENFNPENYSDYDCREQAQRFDRKVFDTNIKEFIEGVYAQQQKMLKSS